MSSEHARDAMRPCQPATAKSEGFQQVCAAGLPTSGPYPLSFWADSFRCTDQTIRDWIREYDIPNCEVGRKDVVIWAEDWWAAFPRRRPSASPAKTRGGARTKRKD